ncbi:extracellular solute-binding protein [Bradyrhizobium australafricanum]|uniref:extracellular solute-binding protein n=1 Tax=Bradyrhizobium australafricanum TaxID=2821406 RepID=UPI001CE346D0|nr:extracellular solute-binding protein [Bradyrhizobium australafricanum]MCA6098187.1 extracellular solute-binding protein [Bradyrhizobium australafricanum]
MERRIRKNVPLHDPVIPAQRVICNRWHVSQAIMRALAIIAITFFLCIDAKVAFAQGSVEWLTLRVALYPAVPQRRALFTQLEQQFERMYPGVNIELVETYEDGGQTKSLADNYYSGGLAKVKADVYEIDTILLTDLADSGKIQPIELPFNDFATTAVDAVRRNGKVYAVPHWMCGNFLFYDNSDASVVAVVEKATNWSALVSGLKALDKKLLVDLYGRSTLGEWYLTAYSDIVGLSQAQIDIKATSQPDPRVVNALSELISVCANGFCRSDDLHSRTGYYARAFVRKEAHVYVGYSETISYGLQDAIENCLGHCLTKDTIGIRRLPAFFEPRKGNGVGWVDGLGIDTTVHGLKKALAEEFVRFIVSDVGYRLALEPEGDSDAPRYLLPARDKLNIAKAPLYPAFLAAHQGRETGIQSGINEALRLMAPNLNLALPTNP